MAFIRPGTRLKAQNATVQGIGPRRVTATGALSAGQSVVAAQGEREIPGSGVAVSQDAAASGSGTAGPAAAQPSFSAPYIELPTPVLGIPYYARLKDYGLNVQQAHIIATSRVMHLGEGILPDGLVYNSVTTEITGTPTSVGGNGTVLNVVGTNGVFDGVADWAHRSNLSGIVSAQNFPDNNSVREVADNMSGNENRSVWASNWSLFGGGSNRMFILSGDSYIGNGASQVDGTGNYRQPLIGPGTANQGIPFDDAPRMQVGDEVWAATTLRHNEAEARWRHLRLGGGNRIHQLKIMMLDETGQGGATSYQATNETQHGMYRGFTGLGTGLNWEEGFSSRCRGSDENYQPAIADANLSPLNGVDPGLSSGGGYGSQWTDCHQDRARYGGTWAYDTDFSLQDGIPDPLTAGKFVPIEYPISVMCHLRRETANTTLVEHYAALLGEDWVLMYSDTVPTGGPYNAANYTNSHTQMDEDPLRPLLERWYDGHLTRVGPTRIPAPGFQT